MDLSSLSLDIGGSSWWRGSSCGVAGNNGATLSPRLQVSEYLVNALSTLCLYHFTITWSWLPDHFSGGMFTALTALTFASRLTYSSFYLNMLFCLFFPVPFLTFHLGLHKGALIFTKDPEKVSSRFLLDRLALECWQIRMCSHVLTFLEHLGHRGECSQPCLHNVL